MNSAITPISIFPLINSLPPIKITIKLLSPIKKRMIGKNHAWILARLKLFLKLVSAYASNLLKIISWILNDFSTDIPLKLSCDYVDRSD